MTEDERLLIERMRQLEQRLAALERREYTSGGGNYAPASKGVTNGDSHDHDGGDGAQIDHSKLKNLAADDHTQYHNNTRGDARYAPIGKGVTNGDSHDHDGGDGAQIDHSKLKNLAADDHTQYHNDTRGDARYAPIGKGVTNGDSHDHDGGDGAQIDHGKLGGLGDDDHTQYLTSGRYEAIVKSRCKAKRSSDKSISNGAWVLVDLDAEEFDDVASGLSPMHDNSTNNSRIYARIDGVYLACANVSFQTNTTGVRGVAICKNANGSLAFANIMTFNIWPTITTDSVGFVMIPLTLSAGDYVEMFVYQTSGGSLNLLSMAYSPLLSLIKL